MKNSFDKGYVLLGEMSGELLFSVGLRLQINASSEPIDFLSTIITTRVIVRVAREPDAKRNSI